MDKLKSTPTNFVATVYGDLVPLNNSALSKARLKVFYKGLNRNGSYINDEIAEKLISTLPGTPVVGYFDADKDDFLGHVQKEVNRAYGFVPENMNFNWEMSLDPDGVYRTYACVDVVLWTGRYPVASKIVGKSHSMELNPDTISGEWVEHDDEICFEFTNAEFIGLCVLGNEYEPCFEGSSFYELQKDNKLSKVKEDLKEMYNLYTQVESIADENPTGGQEMEDENKELIPTEGPEEVEATPAQGEEKPVTEEVVEETTKEVTEEQNGEEEQETPTEEVEEEDSEKAEGSEETPADEEVENQPTEKEVELNAQLVEKDAEIASLKAELAELQSYKAKKVNEEKEAVLNSYANKLTEEEVNNFKSKLESYETIVDLKKDIALCILDKEVEVEEQDEQSQYSLVNSQKTKLTGAASIVAQYVKN